IFLPIRPADTSPKIQVVACAKPTTVVDYVSRFIEEHRPQIDERRRKLEAGEETDAYLLILSPSGDSGFLGPESSRALVGLVDQFRDARARLSRDYFRVLSYYGAATSLDDNFAFRKVLHSQGLSVADAGELIDRAMRDHT